MKSQPQYRHIFFWMFVIFFGISILISFFVWLVVSMTVSEDEMNGAVLALVYAYFGVLLIALCMGVVGRSLLRNRIDFLRYSVAVAVTGEERLRRTPPDVFGTLSGELQSSIFKLRSRLAALEQETDQLATLLSSMSEAVIMTNEYERVLVANPRALELLDRVTSVVDDPDKVEWVGKRLSELTSHRTITDITSDVLWKGRARVDEIEYRDEVNGDTYFYSISTSPIRNHEGNVAGVVIVLYDVTRLRRLERVRRDFVANVSHELRTPIASIKSSAETILLPEIALPSVAVDFAEAILRNADRMGSIVEDLLTLSRLEAEGGVRGVTEVSLPAVFAEVLDRCNGPARKANIVLDIELPDELPCVYGEHRALCQVFFNLVENAIKYAADGGKIRLDAVEVEDEIAASVTDNGLTGIPKLHLPRLFERFYRVDEGRSRKIGGTGLGLSIAKHNVRTMGGRITVTSEPGKTQFTVFLKKYTGGEVKGAAVETPTS